MCMLYYKGSRILTRDTRASGTKRRRRMCVSTPTESPIGPTRLERPHRPARCTWPPDTSARRAVACAVARAIGEGGRWRRELTPHRCFAPSSVLLLTYRVCVGATSTITSRKHTKASDLQNNDNIIMMSNQLAMEKERTNEYVYI